MEKSLLVSLSTEDMKLHVKEFIEETEAYDEMLDEFNNLKCRRDVTHAEITATDARITGTHEYVWKIC